MEKAEPKEKPKDDIKKYFEKNESRGVIFGC
jgi:hypothetical protein